jgi:hypothetical protein
MYRTGGRNRAPRPVRRQAGEARPDGVLEDVFERGDVVLVALDDTCAEAAAENVVTEAVPLVEPARVRAVQVTHPVGEVRLRGLEDEVVVRSEQAVGVEAPVVAVDHAPKEVEEDAAIAVLEEDERAPVPDRGDVVVRTGLEMATRAAHAAEPSGRSPESARAARIVPSPVRSRHVPGT